MGLRTLTVAVVLAAPLVIAAYDLLAQWYGGCDATITAVVRGWAGRWKPLPYFVALAMFLLWMHFFRHRLRGVP